MIRNEEGKFTKGEPPPKHKMGCVCFRCSHTSPMAGKKNPAALGNPQLFKKGFVPWNKGKPMSKELREKVSKACKETYKKGRKNPRKGKKFPQSSGEKHPNWKGGKTPELKRIRNSVEYGLWRKAVFERDKYTCIWCGAKNGLGKTIRLEADHIKPFVLYPELRFAIDNGRTLCAACHRTTGTYGGRKNYSMKDL